MTGKFEECVGVYNMELIVEQCFRKLSKFLDILICNEMILYWFAFTYTVIA